MGSDYKLSFTTGSLFVRGSALLAELYLKEKDWGIARKIALEKNILQSRRGSSSKRVIREIALRLSTLEDSEVGLFMEGNIPEQRLLSFVAVCRYYRFVRDFVIEVVRDNWLQFKTVVDDVDYSRFYEDKELVHEELASVAESTRIKIKQVLFRILAEAGLLSSVKDKVITPPVMPPGLMQVIAEAHPEDLSLMLMSDRDIQEATKKICQ